MDAPDAAATAMSELRARYFKASNLKSSGNEGLDTYRNPYRTPIVT